MPLTVITRLRSAWRDTRAGLAAIKNFAGTGARNTPFGTGSNGMTTNATWMPLNRLNQPLPYERRVGMQNARFLDNNFALVGALNDSLTSYSIGDGVMSYAATEDPEYDAATDFFINAFFESADFDVAGEQTMHEMVPVAVRGMFVDGDAGAAKILPRDANGLPAGDPMLQLFTGDQIDDGDGKGLFPGEKMNQGIGRNSLGRAIRYRVLKEATNGSTPPYWDYKKNEFMLLLDRKRIQLNRGIPWCHRATKNGFSMLDLTALEEAAAYVNALFAAIITTPTGETPESLENFVVQKVSSTTTQKANDGTAEQKQVLKKFVEIFGGAKVPVFPAGTKLEAYQSERPSTVFAGFLDYLAVLMSLSYVMPPSFIWTGSSSTTKPDTRKELAQASWRFNYIFLLAVRRFVKPTRDWLIDYGLLTGRLNNGRGPRNGASPYQATFHGPRDITIDERYFHTTWLARLAAGKGTEEEYFALQGQNGDREALKRIKEIARRKRWCKDHGVQYHGEFIQAAPGMMVGEGKEGDPVNEEEHQQGNNGGKRGKAA